MAQRGGEQPEHGGFAKLKKQGAEGLPKQRSFAEPGTQEKGSNQPDWWALIPGIQIKLQNSQILVVRLL